MTVLFFDIETIIRPEVEDDAWDWAAQRTQRFDTAVALGNKEEEEAVKQLAGTTPEWIQVVGLSVARDEEMPRSAWVGELLEDGREVTEQFLLESFWQLSRGHNSRPPTLVSFNGSAFDLDVIRLRSALLGVKPGRDLSDIKPWDRESHIDTFSLRWPKATRARMGLKDLGKRLNLPLPQFLPIGISQLEGDSVNTLYQEALETRDFSLCKDYGFLDIYLTREFYRVGQGFWWPQQLSRWSEAGFPYDYEAGKWVEEVPPGWE